MQRGRTILPPRIGGNMNQDRLALKICAEGGEAAKWVKRDEDRKPVRYFCGKHMGIHRRIVSSYRSDKWTTEYHQNIIAGVVEMSDVEKAESLLNFTTAKKAQDDAYWAASEKRNKEKARQEILSAPKWLRERVKNYHYEQENVNFTRKVDVVSSTYGVQIELMNWSYIKSRKHAEDLITQLNWVLQKLDEETVKWEDEMSDKIVAADAALAALQAEEGVVA
jgi:ribosome-associated translation inhibitor RaiA